MVTPSRKDSRRTLAKDIADSTIPQTRSVLLNKEDMAAVVSDEHCQDAILAINKSLAERIIHSQVSLFHPQQDLHWEQGRLIVTQQDLQLTQNTLEFDDKYALLARADSFALAASMAVMHDNRASNNLERYEKIQTVANQFAETLEKLPRSQLAKATWKAQTENLKNHLLELARIASPEANDKEAYKQLQNFEAMVVSELPRYDFQSITHLKNGLTREITTQAVASKSAYQETNFEHHRDPRLQNYYQIRQNSERLGNPISAIARHVPGLANRVITTTTFKNADNEVILSSQDASASNYSPIGYDRKQHAEQRVDIAEANIKQHLADFGVEFDTDSNAKHPVLAGNLRERFQKQWGLATPYDGPITITSASYTTPAFYSRGSSDDGITMTDERAQAMQKVNTDLRSINVHMGATMRPINGERLGWLRPSKRAESFAIESENRLVLDSLRQLVAISNPKKMEAGFNALMGQIDANTTNIRSLSPPQLKLIHKQLDELIKKALNDFQDEPEKRHRYKIAASALKDYTQLLGEKPAFGDPNHRQLFLASHEKLIQGNLLGVSTGQCKSSKDRRWEVMTHTIAMEQYYLNRGALPKYQDTDDKNKDKNNKDQDKDDKNKDTDKPRSRFVDTFIEVMHDPTGPFVSNLNSPGAAGLKYGDGIQSMAPRVAQLASNRGIAASLASTVALTLLAAGTAFPPVAIAMLVMAAVTTLVGLTIRGGLGLAHALPSDIHQRAQSTVDHYKSLAKLNKIKIKNPEKLPINQADRAAVAPVANEPEREKLPSNEAKKPGPKAPGPERPTPGSHKDPGPQKVVGSMHQGEKGPPFPAEQADNPKERKQGPGIRVASSARPPRAGGG